MAGESLQAAKAFHDHAAEYDSWFDDSLEYGIELAALRSLKINLSSPKLEIGVGPGRFASDLGVSFGLDPAAAPLLLALGRGINCCRGVGEELPFKDGILGTVYLLFTLCFASGPMKIISETARILKNKGCLVLGMIPANSQWGTLLTAKKEAGHYLYRHASFFTVERVSQWLAEAGMNIVESRSTLYQEPGGVEQHEEPRPVLDEQAGFVVIAARKDDG